MGILFGAGWCNTGTEEQHFFWRYWKGNAYLWAKSLPWIHWDYLHSSIPNMPCKSLDIWPWWKTYQAPSFSGILWFERKCYVEWLHRQWAGSSNRNIPGFLWGPRWWEGTGISVEESGGKRVKSEVRDGKVIHVRLWIFSKFYYICINNQAV